MSSHWITVLLWAAALGSGLMAGVYFAFSVFVMKAFDAIGPMQAVTAMNAVNKVILRSLFMPLFFGSTIVSLVLAASAIVYWNQAGAALALIAGTVYMIGMFACTVVFNVPLNNALSVIDASSDKADPAWTHYLENWTRWNHVRTIASLITCILCIWLLAHH